MDVDHEPAGMDDLQEDVLKLVLQRLPLLDAIRARVVCKRWWNIVPTLNTAHFLDVNPPNVSYCPLIFIRDSEESNSLTWFGFNSTRGQWERLCPLPGLPQVDIRPLNGNGKSLLGFKTTTELSQLVVGNPYMNQSWRRIPVSTETWGEVANILLVDKEDPAVFQIIAIKTAVTEVYNSYLDSWMPPRVRPGRDRLPEYTVECIKNKRINPPLCQGLLYYYRKEILISFDVEREQWTDDAIPLPHHTTSKSFQLLEYAGNLFAATENVAEGTMTVWGLRRTQPQGFTPTAEMPRELYAVMTEKHKGRKLMQLRAVGHKHRMFFWRSLNNKTVNIIVFDFLRREWSLLPSFNEPTPRDSQVFVDAASFEL